MTRPTWGASDCASVRISGENVTQRSVDVPLAEKSVCLGVWKGLECFSCRTCGAVVVIADLPWMRDIRWGHDWNACSVPIFQQDTTKKAKSRLAWHEWCMMDE